MNRVPRGLVGVLLFVAGVGVGGLGVYTWEPRPDQPPRQLEATVFLPTQDDRGKPFPEERWHEAVKVIVAVCGGATVGPEQEGWWQADETTLTHEPVRPVVASFSRGILPRFRQAATEAGRRLGQRAVYIRYEEPRVELLMPDD